MPRYVRALRVNMSFVRKPDRPAADPRDHGADANVTVMNLV